MTASVSKARKPNHTWALGLLILPPIVVYGVLCMSGPASWIEQCWTGPEPTALLEHGAKVNAWIEAGHAHRLATSALLHMSLVHLLANLVFLWIVGLSCNQRWGPGVTLSVSYLGAVGGQTLSWWTHQGPSLGFSGAVFALAALLGVDLVSSLRRSLQEKDGAQPHQKWVMGLALLASTVIVPGVDHAAHAGGAIIGLIMGLTLWCASWTRHAIAAAGGLLVAAMAVLAWSAGPLSPVSPEVQPDPLSGGPALPQVGSPGHYNQGRCLPQTDEAQTVDSTPCVTVPGEMVAVTGSVETIVAHDAEAASHLPPPGRCVQYTGRGEQVLLIRPDQHRMLALAVSPVAWDRYAKLRERLVNDLCPGR